MCVRHVWCLLLLLLYSSQSVESAYHTDFKFDVPVRLDKGTIQSATFITQITAMTVYDSPTGDEKETITNIKFYFKAVHSNGRIFDIPKRQMHKSYKKPLLMIHTPRHLHESQYITPMRTNFHSITTQDPYYVYSLDIIDTGIVYIVPTKVQILNGYARLDVVPKPFDLGAPITGSDDNQNEGLVKLLRSTTSSQNGDYETVDPLNPHFGVKDILDAEANTDDKRRNNNVNQPKFIVPFDTDKDTHVRYSVFIHQRLALIKPQNIHLLFTQYIRFYFNVLDEGVYYRKVDMSQLGISYQVKLLIFIFRTNIFETNVVSPINVRDDVARIGKENFYLCRGVFYEGKHLPEIICEFIQDPDSTGNFRNSKSQRTVEDLDSVVVYMDIDDADTVTLAGITSHFHKSLDDGFASIVTSSYYRSFKDLIAIVSSKNSVPSDSVWTKGVKKMIIQFETQAIVDTSLSNISRLRNFLMGLKIISDGGLYEFVNGMIRCLDEAADFGKRYIQQVHSIIKNNGAVSFTIPVTILTTIKQNLQEMKWFLFPDN